MEDMNFELRPQDQLHCAAVTAAAGNAGGIEMYFLVWKQRKYYSTQGRRIFYHF